MTQASSRPSSSRSIQQRWAFLVGINKYTDPKFSQLNFCVNDVIALEKLLKELDYTVVAMYDEHPEGYRQPTKDNVEAELQQICQQIGEDDLLFVHFACHGRLQEGQPILILRDSRNGLLQQPEKRLSVAQVEKMMRDSTASRLFLSLDACHMGAEMGRGTDDPEFIRNVYELAEGFAVMAGSTAQQKAQEWQAVQHGVYTYYLLKALSGEADRSEKSFVSVDDVSKYVVTHLKRWQVENSGLIQEPTVKIEGMGDMILADWRDRPPSTLSIPVPSSQSPLLVDARDSLPLPDSRRKFYEGQLARKQEELAAIEADLETVSTKKQELKLQKDAEQILQEIEELGKNLSGIDVDSDESTVRATALDDTLRKVDFRDAKDIALGLKTAFDVNQDGFALLLLQRTTLQMGDYCRDEILSTIFGCYVNVDLQKEKTSSYRLCVADFAHGGTTTVGTPLGFLETISGQIGCPTSLDVTGLSQKFRESLCGCLRSGDRVLILVKDWHRLTEPQSFLSWFIEEFWKPLVSEIKHSVIPEYGRIKVVAVLTSSGQIEPKYLSEVSLCTLASFNPHHLIDIPLPNWSVEDIEGWLMDVQKLKRSDSRILAQQIHDESEGKPHTVCSTLKNKYGACKSN